MIIHIVYILIIPSIDAIICRMAENVEGLSLILLALSPVKAQCPLRPAMMTKFMIEVNNRPGTMRNLVHVGSKSSCA